MWLSTKFAQINNEKKTMILVDNSGILIIAMEITQETFAVSMSFTAYAGKICICIAWISAWIQMLKSQWISMKISHVVSEGDGLS